MPVTLKRYINGEVVPLKLSILEALLPAPPRKKKNETGSSPVATTGKALGSDQDSTIFKQGNDAAHTFTAAEDTKLVEMKAANKTWRDIGTEMKKSQGVLKDRFKEIGKSADGGSSTAGEKQGGDQPGAGTQSQAAKTGNDGNNDNKGKDETRPQDSNSATKPSTTQGAATSSSEHDPTTLAEIAAKYDQDKWRFAASKYYDLTGVRISREEAKRKAEQIK